MPHIRQLFSRSRLRAGIAALITTCAVAASTLLPAVPVQAYSGAVILNVYGYTGTLSLRTTSHSLGTCNGSTWPSNANFSVHNTRTCEGDSFGPLNLYLNSVPSGYRFDGFTVGYQSSGVSQASCGSTCRFISFSGARSLTLNLNFSQLPPAAPSTPQPYIASRSTNNVVVAWPTPSVPGGLNRYEARIMYDSVVQAYNTTANSYSFSGLACNKGYAFSVRVYDNYGQSTVSQIISTSTSSCPVAATTPAPSRSAPAPSSPAPSSPAPSNSSNSSSNSGSTSRTTASTSTSSTAASNNKPATAGTPAATGTSSTSTTNPTLGAIDFEDDDDQREEDIEDEVVEDKKAGLNNLTKILIGLGAITVVVVFVRWLYLRQANDPNQYWS